MHGAKGKQLILLITSDETQHKISHILLECCLGYPLCTANKCQLKRKLNEIQKLTDENVEKIDKIFEDKKIDILIV